MSNTRSAPHASFSSLLKTWRKRQRLSQLALAMESGLSQRHISFLETGRSQPSRLDIAQIGEALQMPAAEVDILLLSAGFAAPPSSERWSAEAREAVDASIDHILQSHTPYPAIAVDRIWTLQKANDAALQFFSTLGAVDEPNLLRGICQPGSLRSAIGNWPKVAKGLLRLLEQEVARRPSDTEAHALLAELYAYPGVSDAVRARSSERVSPVFAIEFSIDGQQLNLFSLIATIGMSTDAAIDDIRVETLLPADESTRVWFRQLGN